MNKTVLMWSRERDKRSCTFVFDGFNRCGGGGGTKEGNFCLFFISGLGEGFLVKTGLIICSARDRYRICASAGSYIPVEETYLAPIPVLQPHPGSAVPFQFC